MNINYTQRKMKVEKSGLITGISVKKLYVWFFPNDSPINRRV